MKKGSYSSGPEADAPQAPASPFAALAALREALPPGPGAAPAAPAGAPAKDGKPKKPTGPAKAVVRLEKKGRGGKEVTVVEQLDLRPAEREAWLKDLKGALGCGGALEGEAIVLQGDLRKRLPALLESRGVRQVKVG